MRNLADLPVVSCRFHLENAVDDIEAFRAAARRVDWTEADITRAVIIALRDTPSIDDVGLVLFQHCTELRFA